MEASKFAEHAKSFSRNPLGIIALFIVLVYAMASIVLGVSTENLEVYERLPLVWFLVGFPIIVLGVFTYLVIAKYENLFGPSDFADSESFDRFRNAGLSVEFEGLPEAVQGQDENDDSTFSRQGNVDSELIDNAIQSDLRGHEWQDVDSERQEVYEKSKKVFLAHTIAPSAKKGQLFDIAIYLVRHKSQVFEDIEKTEFYLGKYWGSRIFDGKQFGSYLGIKTSAYGPFLCICRITFRNGDVAVVHRYIDFEMAHLFHHKQYFESNLVLPPPVLDRIDKQFGLVESKIVSSSQRLYVYEIETRSPIRFHQIRRFCREFKITLKISDFDNEWFTPADES